MTRKIHCASENIKVSLRSASKAVCRNGLETEVVFSWKELRKHETACKTSWTLSTINILLNLIEQIDVVLNADGKPTSYNFMQHLSAKFRDEMKASFIER